MKIIMIIIIFSGSHDQGCFWPHGSNLINVHAAHEPLNAHD